MMVKAKRRLEPTTRQEAHDWALRHCSNSDQEFSALNYAVWQESLNWGEGILAESRRKLAGVEHDLGGGGAYVILYFLTRLLKPRVVLETGVAAGWSSHAILAGLSLNGSGHLYSSDFPYFRLRNPEAYIGLLVPHQLCSRWSLDVRGDEVAVPTLLARVETVDLLHYDSDKSYQGRAHVMAEVGPFLTAESVVVMDDIQDNTFFRDWIDASCLPFRVFEFEGKYLGVAGKLWT